MALAVSALHRSRHPSRTQPAILTVPSLPKVHGVSRLVTTRLCEPIHISATGGVFDLSTPSSFIEYNSLHDPHLKSYYFRPSMKRKLMTKEFVTDDLRVLCTLKEYNAYRNFLEVEFMKLRHREEDKRESERKLTSEAKAPLVRSTVDQERAEKRRQFFLRQRLELKQKQRQQKKTKHEDDLREMKALEKKRMDRERMEIKREAEKEQRLLDKLQHKQEDRQTRMSLRHKSENLVFLREIHFQQLKHAERVHHFNEIESRWEKYEEHTHQKKEEEKQRKEFTKNERKKKLERREKIFKILQLRESERREKQVQENHKETEMLKHQADELEEHWKEKKETEAKEWKHKTSVEHEQWEHHAKAQAEARRRESVTHVENLRRNSYKPTSARRGSVITPYKMRFSESGSSSIRAVSAATSRKTVGPSVHFQEVPTVHTFEDCFSEEPSEEDKEKTDEEETRETDESAPTEDRERVDEDAFVSTETSGSSDGDEFIAETGTAGEVIDRGSADNQSGAHSLSSATSSHSPMPNALGMESPTGEVKGDGLISKTPSGESLRSTASSVVEAAISAAVERVNSPTYSNN